MISKEHISALCAVAEGGFTYEATKALASATGWEIVDDEHDLGYLRFGIEIFSGEERRCLVVVFDKSERAPCAFVPLFLFPCEENQLPDFNAAFRSVTQDMERVVGVPSSSGDYGYPHRKWRYSYCWWSVPGVELVLVQDEFDIQDGLDVTLWIRSAGTPIKMPIHP